MVKTPVTWKSGNLECDYSLSNEETFYSQRVLQESEIFNVTK